MTEHHILGPDDLGGSALTGGISTPHADPRVVAHAIEDDERLDRVAEFIDRPATAIGQSSAAPALRGSWLGHALHPALTDLPIGFWTSAFVLDLVGGRRARPAAQRLVGLGLLSVPVTAATGMADYETIDERGARRVGAAHAAGNVVASLCYLASWRARRRHHHARGVLWGFVGGGIATFTAYLGGHLAFGASEGERHHTSRDLPDDHALLDLDETSAMLGVPVAQVRAMVGQGLLEPVGQKSAEPRFRDSDVLAVKLLGG